MADRLVWNEAALQQLLSGPNSPIVADLMRRGQNVESQAKINASGRPGPRVDTGRLRSSISHSPGVGPDGPTAPGVPFVDIGTNVFYGRHLELGWTTRSGRFVQYPFLIPALAAGAA
jgi:hypothetical protein